MNGQQLSFPLDPSSVDIIQRNVIPYVTADPTVFPGTFNGQTIIYNDGTAVHLCIWFTNSSNVGAWRKI